MKRNLNILALAAAALALATACSNETDNQPTRTPLAVGETRGVAAGYFEQGDRLTVIATPKQGGGEGLSARYLYSAGGWAADASGGTLYFEDVASGTEATHTFQLSCGSAALVTDQHTAAQHHEADYVQGSAELNVATRTLHAALLERQAVKLSVTLQQGTGWDSDEPDFHTFLEYLAGASVKVHSTLGDVTPYLPDASDVRQFAAILPVDALPASGAVAFTLTTKATAVGKGREYRCTVSYNASEVSAGTELKVSAKLDATGEVSGVQVEFTGWMDADTDEGELPGNPAGTV